ncbi:MAG: hypothetical protein R2827_10135 [Bdellovibrionales bacterium]
MYSADSVEEVDSTVVATLLTRCLGEERVHCVLLIMACLRKNEYEEVLKNYEHMA